MGKPKKCRLSGGKRKFVSHEAALRRIASLEATGNVAPGITAYQCRHCGGWHMTSRLRARAAAVAGLVPLVLLLGCLGLVAANTWLSLVMPVDRPGWAEVRGRVERPGWYLIFTKQWMRDGSGKIRAMPKQHLDLFK